MTNSRVLAALAYIAWIPSLYIVLSEKRQEEFVGFHGAQALVLWTVIFIVYFAVRFLVNLVWSFYYFPYLDLLEVLTGFGWWGYALYCGVRCYLGQNFIIFH
ncbi:MAG: hypothetical protein ACPL4K_00130 [Candidatus Margulisiibacteriota bacterium]